ncbi:hypothetical protein G6321_00054400 (plasmid) [Bradyrhizobium barranii subsp. barranii]|uniref:Uncharacterized protein n=1 Tax=Bradyrhizobium barranii subsp. barranii TaxID=2823807 RepID=A0A7Z0QL42_9BRAD|nr:hypothetical protein [Bradyrhizobium barranii]UGX99474.1 hypothetical protein G6321_00054400 [Bradyrhizobium barranii subsp. barranii]
MLGLASGYTEGTYHLGNVLFGLGALYLLHFGGIAPRGKFTIAVECVLFVVYAGYFVIYFDLWARMPKVGFRDLAAVTRVFAGYLFLVCSEIVLELSGVLTKWRGEKWAKEMDYVYLMLAAVGLLVSINRLDIVENKPNIPDFYGPFMIATALAVRAVKTRAEIGEWNKDRRGNGD